MKTLKFNEKQLQQLKNQILIVLADYQHTNFITFESVRLDIANRILANAKIIGR